MYLLSQNSFRPYFRAQYVEGSSFSAHRDDSHQGGYIKYGRYAQFKDKPIVRQLLDNIGRLGRELQRVEASQTDLMHPRQTTVGDQMLKEKLAGFSGEAQFSQLHKLESNLLRKGKVVAPILHRSESNLLNKGKEVARILRRLHAFSCRTILTHTRVRKKGKPSSKTPHGPFIRTLFCLARHNTKMFPGREPGHGSCKTVTLFQGPSF